MNLDWRTGRTGASPRVTALPIEEVADRFSELEVLALLGSGGMGSVYKVRQPKLDRVVALKVLAHDPEDSDFVERFAREARVLARMGHANIVTLYEFGEKEGLFYVLMEFVDGITLRDLLAQGRMNPEQALAIVRSICDALGYAHEKGVVHRDIKPENILIDKRGRVKVADFGIARLAGSSPVESGTDEGRVVGTAHYMAPEQVENPAEVDHRADIYALGVVFYEMLTGELPLGRFPPPSRNVPTDARLDAVVLRALEKDPERRYQQADEVRSATEVLDSPPASAKSGEPADAPSGGCSGDNDAGESPGIAEGSASLPWQLAVVAVLFLAAGLLAAWDMARSWGWLFEADSASRRFEWILVILGIPVGIGLLRLRRWWRVVGLVKLWAALLVLVVSIPMLLWFRASVSAISEVLFGLDAIEWFSFEVMFLTLSSVLVVVIWMLRELLRWKPLFQKQGFRRPWIEWAALAAVMAVVVPAMEFAGPAKAPGPESTEGWESPEPAAAGSDLPRLRAEFEGEPAEVVIYQLSSADDTGREQRVLEAVSVPGDEPFVIDVADAPDGDYIIRLRAIGYVGKWHGLTVRDGEYRFTTSVRRQADGYRVHFWKPRYLLMSYYVTYRDEPDFDGDDVRFFRVAASHWANPPVLGGDFIAWQGSPGRRFGPDPFLSRHRYQNGWGQIEIGDRKAFETRTRFEADQEWESSNIDGDPGRAYLVRLRGNSPRDNCYVKLFVEGVFDEPPSGVDIYNDTRPFVREPTVPAGEAVVSQ